MLLAARLQCALEIGIAVEMVFQRAFAAAGDEDEFFELIQPLTQAEKDLIPKGLQKVMLRVLVSEEGMRLPGNFLSK